MAHILIKPIISEKAEGLSGKYNKYSFKVAKDANKIEIKNAVEKMYNVTVEDVNTMIIPGKTKTRYSRSKAMRGMKPAYKKAVVTLKAGDELDFYSQIDAEEDQQQN